MRGCIDEVVAKSELFSTTLIPLKRFKMGHVCRFFCNLLKNKPNFFGTRPNSPKLRNVGTVVLTEFSKAFDLINQSWHIFKFIQIGVRESLIPWQCTLYWQQCVIYNQTLSDYTKLNGELPQGTVMGPLGFQVIVNDALLDASANVWKYVDDLTFSSNVSNSGKNTFLLIGQKQ